MVLTNNLDQSKSSDKWSNWRNLRQTIKKLKKTTFIKTNFFILIKFPTFYIFFIFQGLIYEINIQNNPHPE